MDKKIVLINGPARSGKDTLALNLMTYLYSLQKFRPEVLAFADPLKLATHASFGLFKGNTLIPLAPNYFEEVKDEPKDEFLGYTPRQAYINQGEIAKKAYGKYFYAVIGANRAKASKGDLIIFSDLGFEEEYITQKATFGAENCMIIQVQTEGKEYNDNDSRGPVYPTNASSELLVLHNCGKDINTITNFVLHLVNKPFFKNEN